MCKLSKDTDISLRKRKKSNDVAGENIVLFNQSQLKHLVRKSKYLYGSVHKEGGRVISSNQKINLSTCTHRKIMDFANSFMNKLNYKIKFVGPAYSKNNVITDFQTVVTGTVENDEISNPIKTARREIEEEIGLIPKNIKLKDYRIINGIYVSTYLAIL